MAEPDFIVPPPGLVPTAPDPAAPDRTVRAVPTRSLPSFAPTGPTVGTPGAPSVPGVRPGAPVPGAALPKPPQAVQPATPVTPPSWRLVGASGIEIVVDAVLVLGRDPVAAAGSNARAVAIDDPTRTVSKTHAVIEPADDGVRVTDLRSTNGCRIEAPGGPLREVVPGEPTPVPVGSALFLGELGLRVDRVVRPTV
ncbi:FHA domain-containing protein [Agromyces lapidis]|uniref:FHA domain-containing protein n=1 Tax=Agromyces lapidis TaxID=279574 RepID=A0ABV5SR70_9MICO|nr:FHA domain-containing protein [Agromyces lapidis]